MKKIGFYFSLVCFVILSCTNRDGEIIDLINSVKKQNDDLKAQITSLKKTTDSAMVAITKVTLSQAVTDKKLDAIQTELKLVLAQISSLTTQMTAANADLASIKAKLDALQVKCAELVEQINLLNPAYNLKNGLIAYYPFNGNANDVSGNNLNGILKNTSLSTNRFDINNSAYLFKNSDVYIPFNNKFKVTNLTISAWIRPSSYNPDNYSIILNRFEEGYNTIGGETWQVILTNNEVWFQVIGEGSSGTAPYTILKASKQVQLNTWSLITSSYDGTNMKVYVNGSLLLSQTTTTKINTLGTSGISIGVSKQANGIWHYFDGKIDDVGIWNRALTPEEIKYLYENDFKP